MSAPTINDVVPVDDMVFPLPAKIALNEALTVFPLPPIIDENVPVEQFNIPPPTNEHAPPAIFL